MAIIAVYKERGLGKKGDPVANATFKQVDLGKGEPDIPLQATPQSEQHVYAVSLARGIQGRVEVRGPDGASGSFYVQEALAYQVLIS